MAYSALSADMLPPSMLALELLHSSSPCTRRQHADDDSHALISILQMAAWIHKPTKTFDEDDILDILNKSKAGKLKRDALGALESLTQPYLQQAEHHFRSNAALITNALAGNITQAGRGRKWTKVKLLLKCKPVFFYTPLQLVNNQHLQHLTYLHSVETPDHSPRAFLSLDLHCETVVSETNVTFLYPEERL